MKLDLVLGPDKRLETVCDPILEITADIEKLAHNMIETMQINNGIGLAANQVGHMVRMLVIDISDTRNDPMVFINPQIVFAAGQCSIKESCLSFPGYEIEVPRFFEVRIKAFNEKREPFSLQTHGLAAIVLQHEIDHLDGITMEARSKMAVAGR